MSAPNTGSMKHAIRVLIGTAAVSLLLALLCNLTLDFIQMGGNTGYIWEQSLGKRLVLTLLGTSVIWLIVLLVLTITGRLWLTAGLAFSATILLGVVNYQKLQLRQEPLYPSDWQMAAHPGFLTQMVGWETVAFVALVLGLILVVAILVGRVVSRRFPRITRRSHPRLGKALIFSRLALGVVCVVGLSYVASFNATGNVLRNAYESHGAHWAFWYQKLNYQNNGFVGGVLYNLNVPAMSPPADYSRAEMDRITRKYSIAAAAVNQQRAETGIDDVNVVVALSEAFSDPTRLEGITAGEDPIPFTRSLMQRSSSGQMLAHLFGGGTANMEFEALTGMSLSQFAPQMNTPYQMLVPKYEDFPSAVGYLRQRGHRAVAIHPYMTSMYKREQVYPTLGFEEFVHDKTMASTKKLEKSDFISDESAFGEVERQISRSDEPLLVNLVTMQNHYPMADVYADPIRVDGLKDRDERRQSGGYARGLKYTDDALKNFIASVDASEEKTVVVFYGDHLPALWSEDTQEKNGRRAMRETPFFVYSNFSDNTRQLPTTSPIHFMNHVFEAADAAVPPYYALLGALEREIPAMERGIVINSDDETVRKKDLSEAVKELLHDYELVQYDLSVGKRYSQAEMFYPMTEPVSASDSGD